MENENWGPEKIREFPGDRTEASWLDAIEFLRHSLSDSIGTSVQVGCYWIDDFPSHGSAGCVARVRGRERIAGIASDSWEGLLGWSGNRGKHGNAYVLIFPFLDGSVVQQRGRLADLEPNAEADELLSYRFEMDRFVLKGWVHEDGPGEWAGVTSPGNVYWQKLKLIDSQSTYAAGEPIVSERLKGASARRFKRGQFDRKGSGNSDGRFRLKPSIGVRPWYVGWKWTKRRELISYSRLGCPSGRSLERLESIANQSIGIWRA